ncbi:hypothetical protein [Chondrinema litorale]|uniref:hypothetical protein n=1 Tax=Chondrinema litorale TaxID=2994555 RepID=UPI0025432DA5|nr:hypothetical protein [Chondrinema litorale]UZR95923.1 hypothetical protein OQ292_08870 [Chondrinema litorale]
MDQEKKNLIKSKLGKQKQIINDILIQKEKSELEIESIINELVPPGTILYMGVNEDDPRDYAFYSVVYNWSKINFNKLSDLNHLKALSFTSCHCLRNGGLSKSTFTHFVELDDLDIVSDEEVLNLLEKGQYKKALSLYIERYDS